VRDIVRTFTDILRDVETTTPGAQVPRLARNYRAYEVRAPRSGKLVVEK
jgi:hypothetical protein